ncbi:MAG: glycine dehydrogenase subunit 1 [Acidimicrobiaceae bacterium]|nr:glycine dehydrogenase subunit 1 [Acidimicrobiaceae bacterium]MDQ1445039.1 glycine dehydrogenase subunit 1 [Acidimicrobiaceae bacterium]
MGHYVPHTDDELARMLAFIGLTSLDELFDAVPQAMRLAGGLDLAPGLSEFETLDEMERLAGRNNACGPDLVCFAGAGAYDHEVPAAVKRLAFRSEFVTAYTPYQPEVAQGVLQTLFEYQTLIARLSGVEVANASLYDGASACVEAVNLAVAATGSQRVLLSQGVHPTWREVVRTFAQGTGHEIVEVPLANGVSDWSHGASDHSESAGAVVVQYPNHLGCIEDLAQARAVADRMGALLVVAFDPVAMGVLKTPGAYGADVVVGEGQPFGTPLSFGGPYLGLFACRMEHVRRLPGRLVGETVDTVGRRAYVTTLRTREQDIRREKASSNVCTNQTLIAVVCAIQLGWLGTGGLRELALRCARATRYTRESLLAIDGVQPAADAPVLREFAVRTPVPAETIVERMADEGFLAGVPLAEEYGGGLLVAATERRTKDEIDRYAGAFEKVIR